MGNKIDLSKQAVPLERDLFMRNLIRGLAGTLENVVGLDEASGFISIVGQQIGEWINTEYRNIYKTDQFTPEQVRDVLLDLKSRINGDFYVITEDDEKIVLGNRKCPFGDKVVNRPSICMMTSNVFGTITSDHLGYAKVDISKAIANGDPECRVTVFKKQCSDAEQSQGREYYKSSFT